MSRVNPLVRDALVWKGLPVAVFAGLFSVFGLVGTIFGALMGLFFTALVDILRIKIKTAQISRGHFSKKISQFELIAASMCLSATISKATDFLLHARLIASLAAADDPAQKKIKFLGLDLDSNDASTRLLVRNKQHCSDTIVGLRLRIDHNAIIDVLRARAGREIQKAVFSACFVLANTEGLETDAMKVLASYGLGFDISSDEFSDLVTKEFRLDATGCAILGVSRDADMSEVERAYRTRADRNRDEDELARVAYRKLMDQLVAADEIVGSYRRSFADRHAEPPTEQ